jgi:hypothetical protein
MNADRFITGQTFAEFVTTAVKYKELWTLAARRATVPADVVAAFEGITSPIRFVALNEDWCLDAVGSVPYIAKLADENPLIEFRSFGRDVNPDLMDSHLSGTSRSIPVVIAYDADWNELGWWGPRPTELQKWVLTESAKLEKEAKYHYIRQWYARDHGATPLRELTTIVMSVLHTPVTLPTAIAG